MQRISVAELRKRIHIKERLPIWGLRLILGAILMTLSEIVMWQNPVTHSILDWPILLVLHTALASIMMELVVRYQVRSIPTLLMVSGLYGLASSAIISHSAFDTLPYTLILRSLGLQTAAGLYGFMMFITVMRGKPVEPLQIASAVGVGILWGVWVHWYPIATPANWGLVTIETAQVYIVPTLFIIGALIYLATPHFSTFREDQMSLQWWEAIIVAVPLFFALLFGMIQNTVPFPWLLIMSAVGAFIVWALSTQQGGYDPSILAELMFSAPNMVTYTVLCLVFFGAGTLAYGLITDADSFVGNAIYLLALIFGFAWLPGACALIFWEYLHGRVAGGEAGDKDK